MIKRLNRNQTLVNFFTSVSFILILSLTPLLNYLIELCIHYSAIGTLKRLLTLDSGGLMQVSVIKSKKENCILDGTDKPRRKAENDLEKNGQTFSFFSNCSSEICL